MKIFWLIITKVIWRKIIEKIPYFFRSLREQNNFWISWHWLAVVTNLPQGNVKTYSTVNISQILSKRRTKICCCSSTSRSKHAVVIVVGNSCCTINTFPRKNYHGQKAAVPSEHKYMRQTSSPIMQHFDVFWNSVLELSWE